MASMRTLARLLLVPVAAGLLLVACGSDGDSGGQAATTTSATAVAGTTTAPAATVAPTTTAPAAATSGPEQPTNADVAEITVMVGLDDSPSRVEKVKLGQQVSLSMQSDQDEEYHLHGYDLEEKVAAGTEKTWDFTADKAGQFELESHVTDKVLLVIDVEP